MNNLVIFDCDGVLVDSEIISNRIDAEALTLAQIINHRHKLKLPYSPLFFEDAKKYTLNDLKTKKLENLVTFLLVAMNGFVVSA